METAVAFGRLCVETARNFLLKRHLLTQPPSGGCVLKLCSILFSVKKI